MKKISVEAIQHQTGAYDKWLRFTMENATLFQDTVGHRAIDVVYNPEFEHYGNYVFQRWRTVMMLLFILIKRPLSNPLAIEKLMI